MKKELIVLAALLCFAFVVATPSIPHHFIGLVTYQGELRSMEDAQISASISGSPLGVVGRAEEGNSYYIVVDPKGKTGKISFYIGGFKAKEEASYVAGEETELNLTLNDWSDEWSFCGDGVKNLGEQCDGSDFSGGFIATCESVMLGFYGQSDYTEGSLGCSDSCTYDIIDCSKLADSGCGDGVCNNGETCSSCVGDCGECPSSGGGSSGGGGGGSGGLPSLNVLSVDSGSDGESDAVVLNDNNSASVLFGDVDSDEPGFFSRVTGGVVGAVASTGGIVVGAFVLIVLGGFVAIRVGKKE